MNELKELRAWVIQKVKEHPNLKDEMIDFFQLAVDEIDEGSSLQNEIDLCMNSINELIEETT